MIMRSLLALVLLFLMVGCRDTPEGAYVEITGKIFIFNYRVATATYVVTLGRLRPVPDGAVVQTTFDNPAGGESIVISNKVWPKLEKIAIESPPVFCIIKDKPYGFSIELKGPDGQVLQELTGSVTSSLDQTVLPDRPLVVGPVYTPNPELSGSPNGHLPGQEQIKCNP